MDDGVKERVCKTCFESLGNATRSPKPPSGKHGGELQIGGAEPSATVPSRRALVVVTETNDIDDEDDSGIKGVATGGTVRAAILEQATNEATAKIVDIAVCKQRRNWNITILPNDWESALAAAGGVKPDKKRAAWSNAVATSANFADLFANVPPDVPDDVEQGHCAAGAALGFGSACVVQTPPSPARRKHGHGVAA